MFDTCADGRTLKCLTVIDEFTHACLAIDVADGIRSDRVIDMLAQLVSVNRSTESNVQDWTLSRFCCNIRCSQALKMR